MRKKRKQERTISRSVTFKPEILKKVDLAKGFLSRSTWIMIACDEKLKLEEQKAGLI